MNAIELSHSSKLWLRIDGKHVDSI